MRNPSLPSSHATRDKPSSSRPAAVSQMKPGACNELGEVNGEERRLRRGGSLLAQAPCRTPTLWRCRPSTAPTAGQGQSTRRRGPTERPQPCPRCDPAVLGLRMSVTPPQGGPQPWTCCVSLGPSCHPPAVTISLTVQGWAKSPRAQTQVSTPKARLLPPWLGSCKVEAART